MNSSNKPNIFWIVIDSVRYYDSKQDDRDRIPVFDYLAKDGVEFTNCITSAPSTLLSAGAMFTGLPSIYVSRHFNDWKFNKSDLTTLTNLTTNHKYKPFHIFNSRSQRELFQFLAPPLTNRILPKGYKLSDYVWRNIDITNVFEHIIDNELINEQPNCFTFWYDIRRDPNTNSHVMKTIDLIKEKGFYDNSIIIIHSDHGYPDPSTKLNEEFFKNLGHDMILTDDNVKVPFVIKYPNCPSGKKVDKVIGLIDVLPTIFDILGFNYRKNVVKFQGESILPLIVNDGSSDRIRRSDTRLAMDNGKITCLVNDEFKYIYFYDDGSELLFDRKKDKMEVKNLISDNNYLVKEVCEYFKKIMKSYEFELMEFHQYELHENIIKGFSKYKRKYKNTIISILIITEGSPELLSILISGILQNLDSNITILTTKDKDYSNIVDVENRYEIDNINSQNIKSLKLNRFNLTVYLTENSRRVYLKDEIVSGVRKVKSDNYVMLNYNLEVFDYFSFKSVFTYFKIFFDWEIKGYFYKQEPTYFLKDVVFIFQKMITTLFENSKTEKQDLLAAKEIFEFRNSNLESNEKGIAKVDGEQFDFECEKFKTRE